MVAFKNLISDGFDLLANRDFSEGKKGETEQLIAF
jgi:hypothetical protein